MPFLIIFVVIPLIEISVFMSVGEYIGMGKTLLFAFLTAIIGGMIIKYQGLHTISAMRESSEHGRMPVNEIFDGFCLIAAGATLITPGFVTDTIGFLLLVPPVRTLIRDAIKKRTDIHVGMGQYESHRRQDPDIIEAEYEKIDDERGK